MKKVRTILEIAAAPLFAVLLFVTGMLAAIAHLAALPFLYLWEKYQERRPVGGQRPRGPVS